MAKKTLYFLMDTETTKRNGLVFDFAYDLHDKHGTTYAYGSFLIKDVLAIEEPFYKEKIAEYWTRAYKRLVKPLSMRAIRRHVNTVIRHYQAQGFKIVICAYNAAFDVEHFGMTSQALTGKSLLKPETKDVYLLDLWHAWCMGCPVEYGYTAPMSPAGNIRTTAETVYRYETDNPTFEEKHMAGPDIAIEKVILQAILRRKKKLPIVRKPSEFVGAPWRFAQQRCSKAIEFRKAKQLSMESIKAVIPDLTIKNGYMTADPVENLQLEIENLVEVVEEVITKPPIDNLEEYLFQKLKEQS